MKNAVKIAKTLDKAAKKTGVNFIGGYTALVHKDYTNGERILIESIPEALAATDLVCSSVNVGSTRAGINMDAVKQMGQIVKRAAELTADTQRLRVQSLLYSATRLRIIRLWRVRSMAKARVNVS